MKEKTNLLLAAIFSFIAAGISLIILAIFKLSIVTGGANSHVGMCFLVLVLFCLLFICLVTNVFGELFAIKTLLFSIKNDKSIIGQILAIIGQIWFLLTSFLWGGITPYPAPLLLLVAGILLTKEYKKLIAY